MGAVSSSASGRYVIQSGFICAQCEDFGDHRPWKTGAEVTIKCLPVVSKVVSDALKQADEEWTQALGPGVKTITLKWLKSDEDAMVRIGEGSGVSWCYNGAAASDVSDKTQPTLYIGMGGWTTASGVMWTKAELLRVARHMLGHVYGVCHPLIEGDARKWNTEAIKSQCHLGSIKSDLLIKGPAVRWEGCEGSIMRFDTPNALLLDADGNETAQPPSYVIDAATVKLVRDLYPTYLDVELTTMNTAKDMHAEDKKFLKFKATTKTWNVLTGLSNVSMPLGANRRIASGVQDVGRNGGMRCCISTHEDTVITEAAANWLSFQQNDNRIQTGVVNSCELRDGDWTTAKSGETFTKRVSFDQPFDNPPKVVVAINGFDMSKEWNLRAEVFETEVDCEGFMLHLKSWGTSIPYDIRASWLAHEADDRTIRSGKLLHPAHGKQAEDTAEAVFDSPLPDKPRYMWYAFNKLDIDKDYEMKVNIEVVDYNRTRVVSKVSTWDPECKYWGLGGVYVAIM